MCIAAGIVLYNPEIIKLKENIKAVIVQCDHLYIVDNGSGNLQDIFELIKNFNNDKITIIQNISNEGIAKALNQLCIVAEQDGYKWLLTLDQDSLCQANMLVEYIKYIDDGKIGLLCPLVLDRNKTCIPLQIDGSLIEEVDECITSGSMIRLSAWKKISGFDEAMFIDGVDFDICHRLQKDGFKIMLVRHVILVHELGRIEFRSFLLWKVLVKNHSSFRKYYIARNTVYLARKEKTSLFRALLQNLKLFLINWCYEEGKKEKTKKILKGTWDGLKYPIKR